MFCFFVARGLVTGTEASFTALDVFIYFSIPLGLISFRHLRQTVLWVSGCAHIRWNPMTHAKRQTFFRRAPLVRCYGFPRAQLRTSSLTAAADCVRKHEPYFSKHRFKKKKQKENESSLKVKARVRMRRYFQVPLLSSIVALATQTPLSTRVCCLLYVSH